MTKFREICQLHNHSVYSLLDAIPTPYEWVSWCLENNCPGLAVTDHGTAISMYDAIRFPELIKKYNKAHKTNHPEDAVIGIPGVELYVKLDKEDKSHYHITCWAVSNEGYFNLMKLSSVAYEDTVNYYGSLKGRVTFDQIIKYKKGIKFGTGCIAGPIGKAIMDGKWALAEERYLKYKEMFGDQLYVEFHPTDLTHQFTRVNEKATFKPIEPNECSCDGNMQKAYNIFLMEMVKKYGGKPIPVTDAHFILPEDKVLQDLVLKAGNDNGWFFFESYHQKRSDQIFTMLQPHLGDWLTEERFNEWIDNTYEVMNEAKSINIKFDYHLPEVSIPDAIKEKSSDYNYQTYLFMMQKIAEHGRWNSDPEYVKRFKKELDVIYRNKKLNFIPYFLMYEDMCTFARDNHILQNLGRGSAGGCLISYYLKIIHIDPIQENLPFERFLSHERINAGSFPDIDCDFGDRGPIIKYLKEKYGVGFAQIGTFLRMKTKSAIKDAMWALREKKSTDPEVKAICDQIPDSPQGITEHDFLYGYVDQEEVEHQGLIDTNVHVKNFFANNKDVEKLVKRLLGVMRGWSRHASAFVISTVDLSAQRLPTMIMQDKKSGESIVVTQYEAPMVEKSGLVKADILGVTTIQAVSECVQLIKKNHNIDLNEENDRGVQAIYRLPDDTKVYDDFYNKDTDSSFQFNTPLIKGYIQQFNPRNRQHLSDLTALARPGALDAPFVNNEITEEDGVSAAQYYMDVRSGVRELGHLHPDLEPHTSNAVLVYQEQVMSFLVDVCGYTLEKADQIRSAIGKKKHEVIMATFNDIRIAGKARGWSDSVTETICQQIQAFSRYSFNRSHSRCYAELGYITMWLKRHFPLEWWCAILNSVVDKEDKLRHYVSYLGGKVTPPSINNPSNKFIVLNDKIVSPITVIKGVGEKAIEELATKAPFKSIEDYVERVKHNKVNTAVFSALVRARALDPLMESDLGYLPSRRKLVERYSELRKCKSLVENVMSDDPLEMFLMERDVNTVFNKTLLSDEKIRSYILNQWGNCMTTTTDKRAPLRFALDTVRNKFGTPILADISAAQEIIENADDRAYGMWLLCVGSSYQEGISKTGRKYKKLSVALSDGYTECEGVWWDKSAPLRYKKNTLVFVTGKIKKGWKTPVNIMIQELTSFDDKGSKYV